MSIALWILATATIVHVLCQINKRSKLMIVGVGYWLSLAWMVVGALSAAAIWLINNIAIV